MIFKKSDYKICIVGLGYVGLPLAARFSLKGFDVIGFDINLNRIEELVNLVDKNHDIGIDDLKTLNAKSKLSFNISDIKDRNFFIATKILAKHDENYMPPEVKAALEEK